MARLHIIAQLRIVLSGWFAREVSVIAYLDRSRRIVVSHLAVFDEYTRYTVGSGSHDVMMVEADISQGRRQGGIPVLLACLSTQAQMPLADGTGRIAYALEHICHGKLGRLDNHSRIARSHIGARLAPRIFAREKGVAGWGTGRGDGVGIGETDSLLRQLIHIRCLYVPGTIASQVAITQVIGKDDDDVRLLLIACLRLPGSHRSRASQRRQQGDGDISLVHNDNR